MTNGVRKTMREEITMRALLEWAIADKRADLHADGRGVGQSAGSIVPTGLAGASTYIAANVMSLGTVVQTSMVPLRVDLDPDANLVYCLAERILAPIVFVQVVGYARRRECPDWGAGIRLFEANPQVVWCKRGNAGYMKYAGELFWQKAGEGHWAQIKKVGRCEYCPVIYEDRGRLLGEMRALYLDWWRGLDRLRMEFLRDPYLLRSWFVTSVGAAQKPWEK